MKSFIQRVAEGKRAAMILALNSKLFLDMDIVSIRDMQDEEVEGSDFDTVKVDWIRTELDTDMKDLITEIGQTTDCESLVPELVHGSIEAKSIQPNKSLHRDDLQDKEDVFIPLDMWDGSKKNQKGYRGYSRKRHGSLRRMMEPRWKKSSSVEPLALGFLLMCWDGHGGRRPFASIGFTDFSEFKHRLIVYAKANGLDLTDWSTIPVGEEAENFKCGDLIFIDNVWFVPLDLFEGIARIILIGDAPKFYKHGKCTVELQEKRYQYLCEHAIAHVPLEAIRLDGELKQTVIDHPIFDLLHLDAANMPAIKE